MAINERLIDTEVAAAGNGGGLTEAEQGLILHLDANDVDSYDGDGSEWVDISTFEKTIPLSDNEVDLEIHYDPSDINSYSGTGTTMTNLAGSSLDATVVAAEFDTDNGGFFDVSIVAQNTINVPNGHPLDGTGNSFTLEFWFNWISAPSLAERFIYEPDTGWNFFYYGGNGWRINNADCATGYFANNVASTAGEWNHFAMSQDASNCRVYINGTLVKTQAITSGTRNIDSFSFGSTSLDGVNCKIGSIRMYSAALSASDIGQNYRHGRDTVYTELIPDTDLELHLDADSFPQKNEAGYSNTPSTWTDSSANGNNGTITGATFDSELGNYLDFDGSGDTVTIGTQSYFHSTNDFTAEFWVKRTSNAENLLFKLGSTHPTYYFIYQPNLGYWFKDYTAGNRATYTGSIEELSATLNEWTHIVLVLDGGSIAPKIYVNGEHKSASAVGGNGGTTGSKDLLIGEGWPLAAWGDWEGEIGQVRWYSSKLTDAQIYQNYNFTKPSYPNGYDFSGINMNSADWNPEGYFDFDGSSEYFINNNISLDTSKPFSVSTWFYPTQDSEYQRIFAFGTTATEFILQKRGDNNNSRTIARVGGSIKFDVTGPALPNNTWHLGVVTGDGSNIKMYINDSTAVTDSIDGTYVYNNLQIGFGTGTSEYFTGRVANLKVYDRVLSAAEITALHSNGLY